MFRAKHGSLFKKRAAALEGSSFDDDDGGGERLSQRDHNIRALVSGQMGVVQRQPVMACLSISERDRQLRAPFKSHSSMRTGDSETLLKRRTLGVRRQFSSKFVSKPFRPLKKTSSDEAADDDDDEQAVVDVPAIMNKENKVEVEKVPPHEPLILYRSPPPLEGGEGGEGEEGAEGEGQKTGEDGEGDGDAKGADEEPAAPHEVSVHSCLARWLRPHQRVGLQFMFDCCMGLMEGLDGSGCILADDMGLGKVRICSSLPRRHVNPTPRQPTCHAHLFVPPQRHVTPSPSRLHHHT